MQDTNTNVNGHKKGVIHATDLSFEKIILGSEMPVLVDFWAPWCGPCKALGPVIDELAVEYEGRVRFVKVNTEDSPKVSQAMGIRSIPTMVVFKGKDVFDHKVGAAPRDQIRNMLDRALGVETPGFFSKMFTSK